MFSASRGTRLSIVTIEQDQLIRPAESQALLQHLTGEGGQLFVVTGAEAVHDPIVSNPAAILQTHAPTH
ncbi:MAG: hypothetical protein ACJ8J0_11125 [Longimicrobiaceae bacterium]